MRLDSLCGKDEKSRGPDRRVIITDDAISIVIPSEQPGSPGHAAFACAGVGSDGSLMRMCRKFYATHGQFVRESY